MTGEARRVPALDGLRGGAVALVVLFHLKVPGSTYGGAVGVTAFFVLSGFLITSLLLAEQNRAGRIDLRAFWVRRGLRLLPALTVVLVAAGVLDWLGGGSPGSLSYPEKALAALLYVANLLIVDGRGFLPLSHTWSLSVEEQFYLLWPLVVVALLRWSRRQALVMVAVALAALSIGLRLVAWRQAGYVRTYFATDTNAYAPLLGCAFAAARWCGWRPRVPVWAGPAGMVALLACVQPWAARTDASTAEQLIGIPAAAATLVVIAALTNGPGVRCLEWEPLVTLGRVSYGVYLWHYVLIRNPLTIDLPPWQQGLVCLPGTALATWASWRYVERPALLLKRRLAAGSRAEVLREEHERVGGAVLAADRPAAGGGRVAADADA